MDQQRAKYTHAPVTSEEDIEEEEYEDSWPPRLPNSARRYQELADVRTEVGRAPADVQSLAQQHPYRASTTGGKSKVPPRRSATQTNVPVAHGDRHSDQSALGEHTTGSGRPRVHWLMLVGLTMLTMVIGWVALTTLLSWWQITQDDWHYGRPRTYQVDMVVGHNDSPAAPSHFIALNLNRHIQVIEFPGGDSSKAKIYVGPTLIGPGQDLAVVTLTFKDVNGDGKLDMIVNVQDSHFIFINDAGQFRPARPNENVQL